MEARAIRRRELSSPPDGPMVRLPVWATLAVVALGSGLGHSAVAGCQEAAQELMQALSERDLGAVRNAYAVVEGEVGCDDGFLSQARQAISELHTRAAEVRLSDGATLESHVTCSRVPSSMRGAGGRLRTSAMQHTRGGNSAAPRDCTKNR